MAGGVESDRAEARALVEMVGRHVQAPRQRAHSRRKLAYRQLADDEVVEAGGERLLGIGAVSRRGAADQADGLGGGGGPAHQCGQGFGGMSGRDPRDHDVRGGRHRRGLGDRAGAGHLEDLAGQRLRHGRGNRLTCDGQERHRHRAFGLLVVHLLSQLRHHRHTTGPSLRLRPVSVNHL